MAVTTVLPNGTVDGAGNFDIAGGSATVHAALSDASDSTYISKKSSITGTASTLLDFGTTTITATQKVKRVRVRARIYTPNATGKMNINLGSRISGSNYFFSALSVRGAYTSAKTLTGAWQSYSPDGSAWTQAAINNLRAKVTEYNDSTDVGRTYELYIDVDIVSQPSATVTSPTGTISANTNPDITWTFTDSDGESQTTYDAKIFTAAQYGAGGFNPTTSTATWSSGIVASTDTTIGSSELLLSGTYRAYVRLAKTTSGSLFFSDWAYNGFTISVTPPTTPTLAASWDEVTGKTTLTVTGASTAYVSQYFEIHRSDDAGIIYDQLRNAANLTPSGTYVATAYDYEAARGVIAYYRARAVGIDANSNEFPTAWSTVVQVFTSSDETWWFKAIDNPALNLGSVRVLKDIDVNIQEPNTIFRPLGSNRPVVIAGPIQGEDGTYNVKTLNETEWDNFLPLLNYQGVLLVQDPLGNQKYIRLVSREWIAETQSGSIYREINAGYVEVDA